VIPRTPALALAALGLLLSVTVVPGVFTIDEDHYLVSVAALRHGRLGTPGTEGLPASNELAWFDPQGHSRRVAATPVAPTVPPLYAPLALPFSYLGFRGLVAINTLAYLVITGLVFGLARRFGREPWTPWLAAVAFALGGYSVEYAQGLWPHLLTAALILAAFWAVMEAREGGPWWWAVLAGALAGWATGVRYQNLVLAGALGLGVLLWAPRRLRAALSYAAGLAVPLAASSLLNQLRLGIWNPVSKGAGYFAVAEAKAGGGMLGEAAAMFWARVVDYSLRPPPTGIAGAYLQQDPASGAYVLGTAIKKAWLQSCPWLVLALAALALVWLPRRWLAARPPAQVRELKAMGLLVAPVLALFAVLGPSRTDGFCFNQRYFIELVPLLAVACAWGLEGLGFTPRAGLWGALWGAALAGLPLLASPFSPLRHRVLLAAPLALAGVLLGLWLLSLYRARPALLAGLAGAALGWAVVVHLGDDLPSSRGLRQLNQERLAAVREALPEPVALFAFWGNKDPLGPLLLERDVVIADPFLDQGATAAQLVEAFHAQGRRVVVLVANFPARIFDEMRGDRPAVGLSPGPPPLVEILPAPP
jgi:hypothetical protein